MFILQASIYQLLPLLHSSSSVKEFMATKVPHTILGVNNYTSWAACMKSYLRGEGLWEIVEGNEPEPEPEEYPSATNDSIKTWRRQNAKALHMIQVSCDSTMFSYIIMETSAKSAWSRLASIHRWQYDKVASQIDFTTSYKHGSSSNDPDIPFTSLYNAAINGDRENFKKFVENYPKAISAKISPDGGTALHTAALHGHYDLVKELVELLPAEELELTTIRRATALHIAATGKSVEIAETLVNKNNSLLVLRDTDDHIPLCIAALYGDKRMFHYLYSVTPEEELNPEKSNSGGTLLTNLISMENYGLALNLLERFPKLATAKNVEGRICWNVLAQKNSSFHTGVQLSRWQRWMYDSIIVEDGTNGNDHPNESEHGLVLRCKKGLQHAPDKLLGISKIKEIKLKNRQAGEILSRICKQLACLNSTRDLPSLVMPSMFQATESGNVEFVAKLLKVDPALQWSRTELGGIFHAAVAKRQECIWHLINEITEEKRDLAFIEDYFDNNILHVAGTLAPVSYLSKIPGPAIQMQRELQWFEAVEKIVRPKLREQRNREGKTPRTLFSEQHKALANEARKWMRDTATSCMLVATLIATVMFEGSINIPEGMKDGKYYSQIYVTSGALSFGLATISILMFLSILTSRYAEEDFLETLPKRLSIGLVTLFFSIATMMITFGCSLYINLSESLEKSLEVFIPIVALVAVPATLFATLQFPLFLEVIKSSYRPPLCKLHHSNPSRKKKF